MPSGFAPLAHHRVHAPLFEHQSLAHGGRRADQYGYHFLEGRDLCLFGHPEDKAEDGNLSLQDHRELVLERLGEVADLLRRLYTELLPVPGQRRVDLSRVVERYRSPPARTG